MNYELEKISDMLRRIAKALEKLEQTGIVVYNRKGE